MLDERKRAVLRAIVADYVRSREPVGSKVLVERHQLGVSPATIRNDMAVLEEEGYLVAPHTSAGRIPTDKGYRLFVDQLADARPLSASERRAIQTFLGEPVDLDDAVERAVRLLAQFTHQLAVVQYPSFSRTGVRHVEVVGLSASRILVVVISDSGRVEQRQVEIAGGIAPESVAELRDHLNRVVAGRPFETLPDDLNGFEARFPLELGEAARAVAEAVAETSSERRDDRIVYAGAANLAREREDFGDGLDDLLDALEEQMVLLRLLGEAGQDRLRVSIGTENADIGLTSASVVTSGYGTQTRVLAQLGVVGPTRMDYPATMGAVEAVARYLGRIVSEAP